MDQSTLTRTCVNDPTTILLNFYLQNPRPAATFAPTFDKRILPLAGRFCRRDGGIGRRDGLKHHCLQGHAGSSPAPGTMNPYNYL
jgi:hypothetical protein